MSEVQIKSMTGRDETQIIIFNSIIQDAPDGLTMIVNKKLCVPHERESFLHCTLRLSQILTTSNAMPQLKVSPD